MKYKTKVNKQSIFIPSRMYPVAQKKNFKVFTAENSRQKIEHEALKNELDKYRFRSGNCYENASKVFDIGKELGIDIEFRAGWFCVGYYPVYHSWNVYDDKIIDASFSFFESFVINKAQEEYDGDDPSEYIAKRLKEAEDFYPVTTENCVFGKIPTKETEDQITRYAMKNIKEMAYAGSPDNVDNTISRFIELKKEFPDHPSLHAQCTPLQELLKD
jgi:hypothetical protein